VESLSSQLSCIARATWWRTASALYGWLPQAIAWSPLYIQMAQLAKAEKRGLKAVHFPIGAFSAQTRWVAPRCLCRWRRHPRMGCGTKRDTSRRQPQYPGRSTSDGSCSLHTQSQIGSARSRCNLGLRSPRRDRPHTQAPLHPPGPHHCRQAAMAWQRPSPR
jgi:hypothetical protein